MMVTMAELEKRYNATPPQIRRALRAGKVSSEGEKRWKKYDSAEASDALIARGIKEKVMRKRKAKKAKTVPGLAAPGNSFTAAGEVPPTCGPDCFCRKAESDRSGEARRACRRARAHEQMSIAAWEREQLASGSFLNHALAVPLPTILERLSALETRLSTLEKVVGNCEGATP